MTDVVRVDAEHPDPAAIHRAARCLVAGGLVAFPTETVYGLGADALNPAAVRKIFEAKERPANDPLIVHVAGLDAATDLVATIPETVRLLAARFWPGPLTLVLKRSARVPLEVTAGLDTVAIRVPAHPVARALLDAATIPVAAPSANLFSRPSPTRASHVLEDLAGRIDMVVDGGPTTVGVESTVLDVSGRSPVVLRPGAVTVEMLRSFLPDVRLLDPSGVAEPALASPGLLPQHYAPKAPLTVYEGNVGRASAALVARASAETAAGRRVGVLTMDHDHSALDDTGALAVGIGHRERPEQVAVRLYAALRELDAARVDRILTLAFPDADGLWVALRDRLRRAASETIHVD